MTKQIRRADARRAARPSRGLKRNGSGRAAARPHRGEPWQAEDFLNNVIEHSQDSVIIGGKDGAIIRVNQAFLKLTGYSQREVIGKKPTAFAVMRPGFYQTSAGQPVEIAASYFEDARAATERLFRDGSLGNWQSYILRHDNTLVPVEQNIALLRNEAGEHVGAVSFLRDITERHKAEAALRRSEERYHKLIEHANDAIVSCNREGLIIGFNKSAEAMFGYEAGEVMGTSVFLLVPPDRRERQQEAFADFLQALDAATMERPVGRIIEGLGCRRDGSPIATESSYYALKVQNELIITALIRDVSERKGFEKRLMQNENLRALGELAGGVANDFNNILAAIIGRVQLLNRRLLPPQGAEEKRRGNVLLREGLGIIEKAALDGAETVRRIQEFSRRKEDAALMDVDISAVLQDALAFTKTKWKDEAQAKGIRISVKKKFAQLPAVAGNPSELRELFTNLINNAVDAMPEGGTLTLATSLSGDQASAVITIQDTGTGIQEADLERVFEPFFTTKGVGSSGLGLSVSYGIVNRHHGDIKIKSSAGRGTTFSVYLPVQGTPARQASQPEQAVPTSAPVRASILVIEDEAEVRSMICDVLADHGHAVESASDGAQGLALYRAKPFDIVFTDLGMPGMSGWQVAREIKDMNPAVPVVLITGWNISPASLEPAGNGVDAVLQKPFNISMLSQLLEQLISARGTPC